ncbi:MAG: hypothetical protein PT119_19790 [Aphanizomenon gracile PMC627.10]|nr:hypothetical protein [Aphanizomenon gracile PMC627.10]
MMHEKRYLQPDFFTQNKRGKAGEEKIDLYLKSLGYEIQDVSADPRYQKAGIDRIISQPCGYIAKAKYKTDFKAKQTGNLFFETEANDRRNIPGWGHTSQADIWIFYIPEQEILFVDPGKFRWLVLEHLTTLKKKTVQNKGYCTFGFPVPLESVRKISLYFHPFPPVPF